VVTEQVECKEVVGSARSIGQTMTRKSWIRSGLLKPEAWTKEEEEEEEEEEEVEVKVEEEGGKKECHSREGEESTILWKGIDPRMASQILWQKAQAVSRAGRIRFPELRGGKRRLRRRDITPRMMPRRPPPSIIVKAIAGCRRRILTFSWARASSRSSLSRALDIA